MMHVYPVPGRTVRDPATGLELTSQGVTVATGDPFWLRRLAAGDVTDKSPAAVAAVGSHEGESAADALAVAPAAVKGGGKK